MARPQGDAVQWLPAARGGSSEALGQLLEACRGYLLLVAQRELAPDLHAKGGASDLVQETLLDAVRAFPQFHGTSEAEVLAWLRRLLLNNVISFARRYREADKRQVAREVGLGSRGSGGPAAGGPTPSGQAVEQEEARLLRAALERLPDGYRQVLRLRFEEERSFEDIGRLLGLTPNAARKLWVRAVKRLQQESEGMA
jgi:RNA polymerase sigma-70 factor (ECF subfamily)